MGELRILDSTGDSKIEWDQESDGEVELARRTFENATKKGFRAFRLTKLGNKGAAIQEFDASAEKILLTPPIAGG
jgi:hypothetical protein